MDFSNSWFLSTMKIQACWLYCITVTILVWKSLIGRQSTSKGRMYCGTYQRLVSRNCGAQEPRKRIISVRKKKKIDVTPKFAQLRRVNWRNCGNFSTVPNSSGPYKWGLFFFKANFCFPVPFLSEFIREISSLVL